MYAIQPYYRIYYNDKNITNDVSQYLLELRYTDKITGESDELEISLDNVDGKWSDSWYPEKGANLKIDIGYDETNCIKSLAFKLDEIRLSFSSSEGDVVTIKGIGAGVTNTLKTKKSYAHENKTLSEIVNTIAGKYGYTVVGPVGNIVIGRVTQKREKDITFLQRLADEYGYIFNIKGTKLIFTPIKSLEDVSRVLTLDKTDCMEIEITDKSFEVYNKATVKSHNPNTNQVVSSSYTVTQEANADQIYFPELLKGDTKEVRTKTENQQQAIAKAEASLRKNNSLQQTASIVTPGHKLLLAGNNIELTGIGKLSGIWNILSAGHSISANQGYTTSCELKRIIPGSVSGSSKTPKKPVVKKPSYSVTEVTNRDNIAFPTLNKL